MSKMFEDLRKDLLSALDREISSFGFKLRRTRNDLRRQAPPGFHLFGLGFVPHPGKDFGIMADVALRFDVLERLINEVDPAAGTDLGPESITVGGSMGNPAIGGPLRWTVADQTDLVIVVPTMVNAFRTVALPYYERFSDLNEVLTVCSSDEHGNTAPTVHCPSDIRRAKKAIAAAFLLRNRTAFDELVARKTYYLKNVSKQGADPSSFLAVADTLAARWKV